MTEKRFEFEWDMNISDNLTGKEYDLHCDEAFEFIKIINDIAEENEQLRKDREDLFYRERDTKNKWRDLKQENEQLFNFKENVFNSINGKIKRRERAIEWGKSIGADVGAMGFHIEMLKMLKEELLKMTENKRFEVWKQEPTNETTKSFVCTKKRFIFAHDNVVLDWKTPIMDDDKKMNIGEVLDEMNNLYEENEQLKQKVDFYKYFQKDARELEKENEQLNEDVLRRKENEKLLIKTANDLNELIDKLEKENKQLEEELADANELKEHLDYYKTKCGSLEESLIQKEREISMLKNIVGKIKVLDELIWWNGQKRRLKK